MEESQSFEVSISEYFPAGGDDLRKEYVAELQIGDVTIGLNIDRLNQLIEEVNRFKNITHCYQCKHFDEKFGNFRIGSCKLELLQYMEQYGSHEGEAVAPVMRMSTCWLAERKEAG